MNRRDAIKATLGALAFPYEVLTGGPDTDLPVLSQWLQSPSTTDRWRVDWELNTNWLAPNAYAVNPLRGSATFKNFKDAYEFGVGLLSVFPRAPV
jgi:hypothetical protein